MNQESKQLPDNAILFLQYLKLLAQQYLQH
jgi:hypothetical protein